MLRPSTLKKWLREEYIADNTDFDGFEAKGNINMLDWFIHHHTRVDFGGPFTGKCPKGWVKVGASPWFVFVPADHKEELLNTFTKHRSCASPAPNNAETLTTHPITMSGEDLLQYMRTCEINDFIVKGYGMKSKITWGHSLLGKAYSRDPDCVMHYDVALKLDPEALSNFVKEEKIHKRSHQYDRHGTMNQSSAVISDEENSSDEHGGENDEEDSADDDEDSTGHSSHQNQGNGHHPQTRGSLHNQIAESTPSLEDVDEYITLVKCEDSETLIKQFGNQTTINHYPIFVNAQAEFDSFQGNPPLRGTMKIRRQPRNPEDEERFLAAKIYANFIHTTKMITRQKFEHCSTGRAAMTRLGWLDSCYHNLEGVENHLRIELTLKFDDRDMELYRNYENDDNDALFEFRTCNVEHFVHNIGEVFDHAWTLIAKILKCLSFVHLPLPLVRNSMRRVINYINSKSVPEHFCLDKYRHNSLTTAQKKLCFLVFMNCGIASKDFNSLFIDEFYDDNDQRLPQPLNENSPLQWFLLQVWTHFLKDKIKQEVEQALRLDGYIDTSLTLPVRRRDTNHDYDEEPALQLSLPITEAPVTLAGHPRQPVRNNSYTYSFGAGIVNNAMNGYQPYGAERTGLTDQDLVNSDEYKELEQRLLFIPGSSGKFKYHIHFRKKGRAGSGISKKSIIKTVLRKIKERIQRFIDWREEIKLRHYGIDDEFDEPPEPDELNESDNAEHAELKDRLFFQVDKKGAYRVLKKKGALVMSGKTKDSIIERILTEIRKGKKLFVNWSTNFMLSNHGYPAETYNSIFRDLESSVKFF
jgi:hypothetical protein